MTFSIKLFIMKKKLLYSLIAITLLSFPNISFSQTVNLGILESFEGYTGAGAATNAVGAMWTGDVGTNIGIISGFGLPPSFTGNTYNANAVTAQCRKDLFRLYIHLNDVFVDYPATHAPAFGGGETITSGVYSIGGAGSIGGALTLDGGGNPNAFFIIKFYGAMTVGANAVVNLTGGTKSCNVFFIAQGAISVAADANIKGTLFSKIGAVGLGANAVLEGRMLSLQGALVNGAGAKASLPPGTCTIPIFCESICSAAPAVDVLGVLSNYALYTNVGAVPNTSTSGIDGNIGTSAGDISGFENSVTIGSFHNADASTAQANIDLDNAYNLLIALPNTITAHAAAFGSVAPGGETINAGVYFIAGAGSLGGTLVLDGQNNSNAIFVFKFAGAFTVAAQAKMILINGARRCNVFFIGGAGVPTGAISIGAGAVLKGTFLSHGGACGSGADVFLAGRQLSTGGAVVTYTGIIYNNPVCITSIPLNLPAIKAVNDSAAFNGFTGGTFTNVLSNDSLNGLAVVASQVTTSFVSSTNAGITLSGTNVVVAAGTPIGTYSLIYKICEVLNPTNCSQAVVTITIDCLPITTPILNIIQPSCSVATGTITVSTPTGSGITYSINNTTYQASSIFSGLAANSYNVTVKNAGGCISNGTVAVINSQPTTPASATVSITQPTCSVATGTITVSAPTGSGITFSIDNTTYHTSSIFSGLAANSYNVTVKNAGGCISNGTVAVINSQPTTPASATVSIIQPTCSVATGNITVSTPTGSGITFSIDNTTYHTSSIFSGLAANSHNVTVKNASGCISNGTVAVINSQPTTPASATVSITQPTCSVATGTITVSAPTGSGITFSIDNTTYQTSSIFSGLAANSYNVTVKNAGGCISNGTVAVINSQSSVPTSATVSIIQPTCSVATGTITVSTPTGSGLTYSINNTTYQTSPIFSGLAANSYNVTVKNAGGCISNGTVAVINSQSSAPASATVALTQPTCSVATGTITVSTPTGSGLTFSINNTTYQTSPIFSGLAANSYIVTVKNAGGCISNGCSCYGTAAVIKPQPSAPASATVALTQPTCLVATGTITVSAPMGSALTYSIYNSIYQTSPIFSGLAANSYNVTVKNASGCSSTATVAVINSQPSTCNRAGIYHTTLTCTDYKNNSGSQLVGQLCYTTSSNKISNVTPGLFFYYTTIIAPSASFCIDIVETKSCNSLALFGIQQLNQVTLWDASCVNKASGTQVSLGLGRVCISKATVGAKYVLSVKYNAQSVIGACYTGTAPICQYSFESRINGITVANSYTYIEMKPNCSSTITKSGNNEMIKTDKFAVVLAPNPSFDNFGLQIKSKSYEKVTIKIFDIHGRIIQKINSNPEEIISFGNQLSSGFYFIETTQELERKVIKAQKL
jgi:hypothetical protein